MFFPVQLNVNFYTWLPLLTAPLAFDRNDSKEPVTRASKKGQVWKKNTI